MTAAEAAASPMPRVPKNKALVPGQSGTARNMPTTAVTDVDLSDSHTVSVTPEGTGYRGALTAAIADLSTGDGAGSIGWTFEVEDSALDDLAAAFAACFLTLGCFMLII